MMPSIWETATIGYEIVNTKSTKETTCRHKGARHGAISCAGRQS